MHCASLASYRPLNERRYFCVRCFGWRLFAVHSPPLSTQFDLATGSSNARMFFLLSIIRSALSRNCRAKLSRYSAMQRSVLLRRASRVQSRIARSNSLEFPLSCSQ